MKKTLAVLLVLAMLATTLAVVASANNNEYEPRDRSGVPYYLSVTGTVISIDEYGFEDWVRVVIEDEEGNPATLVITDRTVFPFEENISIDDVVTAYYLTDGPMAMIWPPRYLVQVLVNGMPEDANVHVDRFYEWEDHERDYLIGRGGMFAFLVDEDTEIILADGQEFDGPFAGRRLVVIYDISTRSIPALATANKVIVLFEDAVPLPGLDDIDLIDYPDFQLDVTAMPILVDGVEIDAPAAFMHGNGFTVMVPLRAIAEALGFEVIWDADAFAVNLNDLVRLELDGEYYLLDGSDLDLPYHIILPSPVLHNDFTYVPLLFFNHVAGMANAFVFEGLIEIHSEGEEMR